jgi:hypothetical protein
MRNSTIGLLAALASLTTCNASAATFNVRYINPGGVTYETLTWTVDGQPYVETPSGCPGPGDPVTGPICVAALQLGEGLHQVKAKAWAADAEGEYSWTVFSNTIEVQGAPEPAVWVSLGAGLALLAWIGRGRAKGRG